MIYIHVPFCKSRCHYCDFFSSVRLDLVQSYVDALCAEAESRRGEMERAGANTVYIGGGTPSQLTGGQLRQIFGVLPELCKGAEVTIEVNPDDVTDVFLSELQRTPVNRVSMGVQSLDDDVLARINRRHRAADAVRAVDMLREAGYTNLSLDLMYGLPGQTMETWKRDVDGVLAMDVPHLSAYSLQWEDGTVLSRMRDRGEVQEADEETSLAMYGYLADMTRKCGMEHYEISNFCKPGMYSRHNSGYWREDAYVGLGPGAHSYDGHRVRRSNNADLESYCAGRVLYGEEHLTDDELYDEMVMKRLRTSAGICIEEVPGEHVDYMLRMAEKHIRSGRMVLEEGRLRLSREGIFVSNDIMSDLML